MHADLIHMEREIEKDRDRDRDRESKKEPESERACVLAFVLARAFVGGWLCWGTVTVGASVGGSVFARIDVDEHAK